MRRPADRERRTHFEAAIERDDAHELADLLLDLAHEAEDREWAECCCAQLAKHRSAEVRGHAIAGFGHLARRFGHLDVRRVHRLVEIGLHDRHEYVREHAESAAEDLETFLAWQFERPPPG